MQLHPAAAVGATLQHRPHQARPEVREGLHGLQRRAVPAGTVQFGDGDDTARLIATDMQGIYNNWATQGLTYYVAARCNWSSS